MEQRCVFVCPCYGHCHMHLNLYFILRPNLSHCSAASDTDSRSTTGYAEPKSWRRCEHVATEEECYEHLYILHVYDPLLFSSVNLHVHFSDKRQSIKCLELCRHCVLYEFLYQSISVLLATERASSSNFKNYTKYAV